MWEEERFRSLCFELIKAESEEEAKRILIEYKLWNNKDYWFDYGKDEFNYRTTGNQQANADAALVEKIINSIDAVILKDAQFSNLDPEDLNAPKTVAEAVDRFYGIPEGKLINEIKSKRKELAKNILLVASGKGQEGNSRPSISIIDQGEGQYPEDFEDTFLSLSGTNKVRTPYVQGKFNMGSTGVLEFCGDLHLQLILSKRHSMITNDNEQAPWGFTIVRRFKATDSNQMKLDSYKYLKINGIIPKFFAKSINLLPTDGTLDNYSKPLHEGTMVKMYSYDLPVGLKSQVRQSLFSRLNILLPQIALPISVYERRNFKGSDYCVYLEGIYTSLLENNTNVDKENIFDGAIYYEGKKLPYYVFIFLAGKRSSYFGKETIILSINGQMQGEFKKSLIQSANLGYLADDMILLLDCTNLDRSTQLSLFMNSRDRIRGEKTKELQKILKEELKGHPGLKILNRERRNEKMRSPPGDRKNVNDTLLKVFLYTKNIVDTLPKGENRSLRNPINLSPHNSESIYNGNFWPTFFTPEKKFTLDNPKIFYRGNSVRIFFKTDAENDYFRRNKHPGKYDIWSDSHDKLKFNASFNCSNGRATLTIKKIDKNIQSETLIRFKIKVFDETQVVHYDSFMLKIENERLNSISNKSVRKLPAGDKGEGNLDSDKHDFPNITEVYRKDWEEYDFNKFSALKVIKNENGKYDYFINMDNYYLLSHLKLENKQNIETVKQFYQSAVISNAVGVINQITREYENKENNLEVEDDLTGKIQEQVIKTTEATVISSLALYDTFVKN